LVNHTSEANWVSFWVYNCCMYGQASQMQSLPVISLQTGEVVAVTRLPVIDISTLDIQAYRCESMRTKQSLILMARDIRQLAADCLIVDTEEELMEPTDIIRLQAMLKADYNPLDKAVVSDTGRKLGHVEDYTINLETNCVQKLQVRQSILRSWLGTTSLVVDRSQIIDVTPKLITVRDATVNAPIMQSEPVPESPS
jgi:sporulation protein YlmC with PRC-barrel domain